MTKVAVQLLVGQNEEPFLAYAIRSVPWVDYFTVCNTSPDTPIGKANEAIVRVEIPEEKLRYTNLHPSQGGQFSFAEARNKCLELTDADDYVLIVDADDVHYPELEELVRSSAGTYDSITMYFYHLMVYKNLYQYVQPREIVYTNYQGTHWEKGVHEQLVNEKHSPTTSLYHYLHYGYVKPQREVFDRWKFYSDLEHDYDHYKGQDPDTILNDRIEVSEPLQIEPPEVIQEFLKDYPEYSPENLRQSPQRRGTHGENMVGLTLLTVNDAELLPKCLDSLKATTKPPRFTVFAIDCNSTDNSVEILQDYQQQGDLDIEIVGAESYVSLSEALNYAFDHFRQHEAYEYVGWIHPDMQFVQQDWLKNLWQELQDHPEIGKICAANFRDAMPTELISGHEQCYILRKDILHKIGLFDEGYKGIGGYEDWDFNKRVMLHSGPEGPYKVMITPKAWCQHEGMATRSRRDTRAEQTQNGMYYFNKWGTWEPPC